MSLDLNISQEIMNDCNESYVKFKDAFSKLYDIDIHPSVLKLCFMKGYEMGATKIHKLIGDAILDLDS